MFKPTPYPATFHVAHRFFQVDGGTWGDILDGPMVEEEDVIDAILESFKDEEPPMRDNLRVWEVSCDGVCRDVTQWALECIVDALSENY